MTREALARVVRERVPIVFSSMRTRAEVEVIQQALDIAHPFICELVRQSSFRTATSVLTFRIHARSPGTTHRIGQAIR